MPLLAGTLFAGEKGPESKERPEVKALPSTPAKEDPAPMPWLGLDVTVLDEMMRAHASGVPEGVGFLVKAVSSDSPAKKAGFRRYDVLWKFDEQLLVNEAQFATLLKLRKVGDEVKMGILRCGKQLELDLVLGEMPENPEVVGISPADLPLIPSGVPGLPIVRVTPHDRTAETTRNDGSSAKLFYNDDEAFVTILGADQEVIYDGPLRKDGHFAVPDDWNHSIGAMLRSLYKANNPGWKPRQPRPRVVIPANKDER